MPAGLIYRALDWNFNNMQNPTTWRASASYVTGAHSMKIGYVAAYNRTDLFERRRELMASWAAFATAKPADVVQLRA